MLVAIKKKNIILPPSLIFEETSDDKQVDVA